MVSVRTFPTFTFPAFVIGSGTFSPGYAKVEKSEGDILRLEADGLSVWAGLSKNQPVGGNEAWLYRFEGSITVKNPDQELLSEMHEVAQQLCMKIKRL